MMFFVRNVLLAMCVIGVMFACHAVNMPPAKAAPMIRVTLPIPPLPVVQYSDEDIMCARNAVFGEARGEAFEVKVAVAATILTRSKTAPWKGSLCKVVKQPNQFHGYSLRIVLGNEKAAEMWDDSHDAVVAAIRHYDSLPWQMREATHFHTFTGKYTHSRAEFMKRYGNLLFYSYG